MKLAMGMTVRVVNKQSKYEYDIAPAMRKDMNRSRCIGQITNMVGDRVDVTFLGSGRSWMYGRDEIVKVIKNEVWKRMLARLPRLTPKTFAREMDVCNEWANKLTRCKSWKQAYNKLIHAHGEMFRACDALRGLAERGDSSIKCLCGQPYNVWMDALEKVSGRKVQR